MSENANNIYQKYAPGQIWFMELTQSSVSDDKERHYLIIASSLSRLTLLKMTHGGEYSSNWIYPIPNNDSTTSKIIHDCPIVVNLEDVKINVKSLRVLRRQDFIAIMQAYIAMVTCMSTYEDVLLSETSVQAIQNEVSRYDESFYRFARYAAFEDVSRYETAPGIRLIVNDVPKPVKPVPVPVEEEIVETVEESEVIEDTEDIDDELEDDVDTEIDDEEDIVIEDEPKISRYKKHELPELKLEDIIILGVGNTSLDDIHKACEQFGIKNARFELSDLVNRKKCAYVGSRYNFTLKIHYNKKNGDGKRKKRDFAKVTRYLRDDFERLGATTTAAIWDTSKASIYKYTKSA